MIKNAILIDEATRIKIGELLVGRVADGIVVAQSAKHAHWNVRGRNFISIHELFDRVHEHVEEFTDLLAERQAQLGTHVNGTTSGAVERSSISVYPEGIVREEDHLKALGRAITEFDASIRSDIERIESLGDPITVDLLTEISRGLEKDLWLLESHLELAEPRRESRKATARGMVRPRSEGRETSATF